MYFLSTVCLAVAKASFLRYSVLFLRYYYLFYAYGTPILSNSIFAVLHPCGTPSLRYSVLLLMYSVLAVLCPRGIYAPVLLSWLHLCRRLRTLCHLYHPYTVYRPCNLCASFLHLAQQIVGLGDALVSALRRQRQCCRRAAWEFALENPYLVHNQCCCRPYSTG